MLLIGVAAALAWTVTVVDDMDFPFAGTRVRAVCEDSEAVGVAHTDANGNAEIEAPGREHCWLVVDREAFETVHLPARPDKTQFRVVLEVSPWPGSPVFRKQVIRMGRKRPWGRQRAVARLLHEGGCTQCSYTRQKLVLVPRARYTRVIVRERSGRCTTVARRLFRWPGRGKVERFTLPRSVWADVELAARDGAGRGDSRADTRDRAQGVVDTPSQQLLLALLTAKRSDLASDLGATLLDGAPGPRPLEPWTGAFSEGGRSTVAFSSTGGELAVHTLWMQGVPCSVEGNAARCSWTSSQDLGSAIDLEFQWLGKEMLMTEVRTDSALQTVVRESVLRPARAAASPPAWVVSRSREPDE